MEACDCMSGHSLAVSHCSSRRSGAVHLFRRTGTAQFEFGSVLFRASDVEVDVPGGADHCHPAAWYSLLRGWQGSCASMVSAVQRFVPDTVACFPPRWRLTSPLLEADCSPGSVTRERRSSSDRTIAIVVLSPVSATSASRSRSTRAFLMVTALDRPWSGQ